VLTWHKVCNHHCLLLLSCRACGPQQLGPLGHWLLLCLLPVLRQRWRTLLLLLCWWHDL
jgi:hypothetical protein